MEPCQQETVIEMIRGDLSEIKTDVKSLLKFKWQIMGGSILGGSLLGLISFYITTFLF